MYQIKSVFSKVIASILLLSILFLQFPVMNVSAAGVITPLKGWIRARIDYEYDDGITKLNDKIIKFSSNKWVKKSDGWYYYNESVKAGETIYFIDGVTFPTSWTEDVQGKDFKIIVTVEAAETPSTDETGWSSNTEVSYSRTFELWTTSTATEDSSTWNGRLKVSISEYELDEDGNEVDYVNDKLVVPGQFVSKIVKIKLQRTLIRPTGDSNNIYLYGGILLVAIAGVYVLTKKRKKPDEIEEHQD